MIEQQGKADAGTNAAARVACGDKRCPAWPTVGVSRVMRDAAYTALPGGERSVMFFICSTFADRPNPDGDMNA